MADETENERPAPVAPSSPATPGDGGLHARVGALEAEVAEQQQQAERQALLELQQRRAAAGWQNLHVPGAYPARVIRKVSS